MKRERGFGLVEVIISAVLLGAALLFFASYTSQTTRNRKYISSFSDLNVIESSVRLALQDRKACSSILGRDPDSTNQVKKILNNGTVNSFVPSEQFILRVQSDNEGVNYQSLKFGDTYLIRQGELRPSGLKINRLRLKIRTVGSRMSRGAGTPALYQYYATLLIGGDYRSSLQENSQENQSILESLAIIPLMILVNEDGTFAECTSGNVSSSEGKCRIVNTSENAYLGTGYASCNGDEVLVLGGAKCENPSQALWANFPGMTNWWIARCSNPDSSTPFIDSSPVTMYGYCCPQ